MKTYFSLLALLLLPLLSVAQESIKIAFVGNSITQGPGRENPGSFPLQVGQILGNAYEVKNFGSKPQNWAHKTEFVQDYLDLIAEFRDHMPKDGKVYVILPVPVTRVNFGITPDVMNNEQRLMLFEIIQKSGAEVIDLYTPLMDRPELMPDGVHPNAEGLGIMARVISRRIRM